MSADWLHRTPGAALVAVLFSGLAAEALAAGPTQAEPEHEYVFYAASRANKVIVFVDLKSARRVGDKANYDELAIYQEGVQLGGKTVEHVVRALVTDCEAHTTQTLVNTFYSADGEQLYELRKVSDVRHVQSGTFAWREMGYVCGTDRGEGEPRFATVQAASARAHQLLASPEMMLKLAPAD
jgi:hypothetical protein